jgi:uroporphyrinogen-III synthase
MNGRVLVTRPEPGAAQTARRLEELGFSPVLLPLSETRALPVDIAAIPVAAAAVAVTSANALRHASRDLISVLTDRPCFAVGEKTATAARAAGFPKVTQGPGGAEQLARMLVQQAAPGATVVYLCGRVRLCSFEELLAAAGIAVVAVETYDTVGPTDAEDADYLSLIGQPVDAAVLYSVMAAEALLDIADQPKVSHLFENTTFLCLSPRIASVISNRARAKFLIAAEPTEEALLSLLSKQSRASP